MYARVENYLLKNILRELIVASAPATKPPWNSTYSDARANFHF
jgi:hypothetical protein